MSVRATMKTFLVGAGIALLACSSAFAATLPSAEEQEALVKTSLMTFNDANLTGNYAVLHAKAAKPFRDQISADQLKQIFKDFAGKSIDLSRAVVKPVKPGPDTKLDDDVLALAGTISITDTYMVTYSFKYIQSDGLWKLIALNVKT